MSRRTLRCTEEKPTTLKGSRSQDRALPLVGGWPCVGGMAVGAAAAGTLCRKLACARQAWHAFNVCHASCMAHLQLQPAQRRPRSPVVCPAWLAPLVSLWCLFAALPGRRGDTGAYGLERTSEAAVGKCTMCSWPAIRCHTPHQHNPPRSEPQT